jgi:hypothetical protein
MALMVGPLTASEVIALRERYANEQCVCGHARAAHHRPDGSTAWCSTKKCVCSAYAWDGTPRLTAGG